MNEQTSDEYWLMTYRLKTKRQKKRLVYKDRDKQLLQLNRLVNRLQKDIRSLGWEELTHPYQRGWKRSFVLRADVAQGKEAKFYEGILSKINNTQFSSRKDFKKKKRVRRKRVYLPRAQKLTELYDYMIRKAKFTEKELQKFEWKYNYQPAKNTWEKKLVFTEPWRFVLAVAPNMITKIKKRDYDMEKELAEIEYYIKRNNLWQAITKLRYGSCYKSTRWNIKWHDPRQSNAYKNVPLHRILAAAQNDNLPPEEAK